MCRPSMGRACLVVKGVENIMILQIEIMTLKP